MRQAIGGRREGHSPLPLVAMFLLLEAELDRALCSVAYVLCIKVPCQALSYLNVIEKGCYAFYKSILWLICNNWIRYKRTPKTTTPQLQRHPYYIGSHEMITRLACSKSCAWTSRFDQSNSIVVDVGKACKYTGSVPPAMSMSSKGHKAAASPGSHITFSIHKIYTVQHTLPLSIVYSRWYPVLMYFLCDETVNKCFTQNCNIASCSVDCINPYLIVDWRSNEILTPITHFPFNNSYMQFSEQHMLHD